MALCVWNVHFCVNFMPEFTYIKSKHMSTSSEELQARSGFGDVQQCVCVCVQGWRNKHSSKTKKFSHWEKTEFGWDIWAGSWGQVCQPVWSLTRESFTRRPKVLLTGRAHSGTTVAPVAAHKVCVRCMLSPGLWTWPCGPLKASGRASVRTNVKSREGLFLVEKDLLLLVPRGCRGRLGSSHLPPWSSWPAREPPSKKGGGWPVHDLPGGCLCPACALHHHAWTSGSLPVTFCKYCVRRAN